MMIFIMKLVSHFFRNSDCFLQSFLYFYRKSKEKIAKITKRKFDFLIFYEWKSFANLFLIFNKSEKINLSREKILLRYKMNWYEWILNSNFCAFDLILQRKISFSWLFAKEMQKNPVLANNFFVCIKELLKRKKLVRMAR